MVVWRQLGSSRLQASPKIFVRTSVLEFIFINNLTCIVCVDRLTRLLTVVVEEMLGPKQSVFYLTAIAWELCGH